MGTLPKSSRLLPTLPNPSEPAGKVVALAASCPAGSAWVRFDVDAI